MIRKLIDTNIIIRILVRDHDEHYSIAARYFQEIDAGLYVGVITPVIIAECFYVLRSNYKYPRIQIALMMELFFESTHLEVEERPIVTSTLGYYKDHSLDFADCYLLAKKKTGRYSEILTFDKKMGGV